MRNVCLNLIYVSAVMMLSGCASMPVGNPAVPQPAKAVDLNLYKGLWYEVGRYENRFETDCEGVTAEYTPRADGVIEVLNTCRKGAPNGAASTAKGKAKLAGDAKLKVSFFGPFYADYWVLDRAEDYSWAIVGEPSGKYLWILSRTAPISADQKAQFTQKAKALGYDTTLVHWTTH